VALFVGAAIVAAGSAAAAPSFDDVDSEGFGPAVEALYEAGVIQGCEDGRFCPDDVLTRAQMATVLTGALDLPYVSTSVFVDVDDNVHLDGINALAASEITLGCTPTAFCPSDEITRAQLSSLLVRGFDVPETDSVFFDDVGGVHEAAVNRLAAVGVAAGCTDSLVDFCRNEPLLRWQAALFLARAMELVEPVALAPLEERREQQAEIDAELERQREEEQARQAEQERDAERDAIWDALADCETGDRINGEVVPGTARWHVGATDPDKDERPSWSSGIYDGGLQFHPTTWDAYRDPDMPAVAGDATREQQIEVAERVQAAQGWGAWPACSERLGLG
jgi:hypothetical protein